MKYCKKCGMLLEDTQEICIGCGTDVSEPENTSIFPPEVAEKMESRKAREKKKNSIIIAIVIVFILLAVLIGVIAVVASKSASGGTVSSRDRHNKEASADNEASADAGASAVSEADTDADADAGTESAESSAETAEEPAEAEAVEEDKPVDNRKVSDAQGNYYNVGEVYDEAGMLMFTTLYPEDFGDGEPTVNFDYSRYSDKFPAVMSYVISDAENTMRLTYMSAEHYWYQVSTTTGKKRNNEVDLDNYMSYLTYENPQSYLEALIKQAYSGAKIELVETKEASEAVQESLELLLKDKTKSLTGDIGDYAKIGSSTTYATGESGSSATFYKYVIKTGSGEVYADYYVPLIYNTFYYANDQLSDQGSVTEWLPLCVISYESGNKEKYEFYEEAFTVFVNNSKLTKDFFRVNEAYGEIIDKAISERKDPAPMTADLLKQTESKFDSSAKLKQLDSDIYNFLSTPDSNLKTFIKGDIRVTGGTDSMQAFYSQEKKMVFITPSESEYPGSEFTDLSEQ